MADIDFIELLEELEQEEFKKFKWHLKKETWNNIEPIKPVKLERAEREDVIDLMVQKYQLTGTAMVITNIFKKLSRNDLVNKVTTLIPGTAAEGSSPAASANSAVDSVELLQSSRSNFVDKVSAAVLQQLLDKMLEKKVLNDAEIEFGNINRAEKARSVIDMVRKKGAKASSALIASLCELDSCLAEELKFK